MTDPCSNDTLLLPVELQRVNHAASTNNPRFYAAKCGSLYNQNCYVQLNPYRANSYAARYSSSGSLRHCSLRHCALGGHASCAPDGPCN